MVKDSTRHLFVLGLTGGIGSGKTAASDLFASQGITVVDADLVSRQVVTPGSPALLSIAAHFGADILLPDGSLDRKSLRARIFSRPEDKHWLESLLHPLIQAEIGRQIEQADSPYVILSSPLLFETGQDRMVDRVLLIDVPESIQRQRTSARDEISNEAVDRIMATQLSREQRRAQADDILVNDRDLQHLAAQVKTLHHHYLQLAGLRT
ncbi:MAG: dephospho-CoA kinase [Pseudomonadales bacterium]|nr:dephospho-CoA kinase [Pseudomonadales bacterium]